MCWNTFCWNMNGLVMEKTSNTVMTGGSTLNLRVKRVLYSKKKRETMNSMADKHHVLEYLQQIDFNMADEI